MNLIVSTCGTSILTNPLAGEQPPSIIREYANVADEAQIPRQDREILAAHVSQRRSLLVTASVDQARRLSAELNGLLALHQYRPDFPKADQHVLIHTDTWLGRLAAELVAEKIQTFGPEPQLQPIKNLSTASRESFDDGLRNLVDWAAAALPGFRQARYRITFNLVGGFKAVQGFMQTLGMFYADEITYIFETGSELLRIPRLPVDLNAAARDLMTRHATLFRRLDTLGPQPTPTIAPAGIPESMLYVIDDETELSPWGKLLWSTIKDELYAQKLHDPPSEKIRFTDAFRSDARDLRGDRRRILNNRIDDLTRYLEAPDHPNPKRLDLKKLARNPMPPSTHEADAWADADCRRIFLHYESGDAILDRLTGPLH